MAFSDLVARQVPCCGIYRALRKTAEEGKQFSMNVSSISFESQGVLVRVRPTQPRNDPKVSSRPGNPNFILSCLSSSGVINDRHRR